MCSECSPAARTLKYLRRSSNRCSHWHHGIKLVPLIVRRIWYVCHVEKNVPYVFEHWRTWSLLSSLSHSTSIHNSWGQQRGWRRHRRHVACGLRGLLATMTLSSPPQPPSPHYDKHWGLRQGWGLALSPRMTARADVVVAAASAARPTTMSEDDDEDGGAIVATALADCAFLLAMTARWGMGAPSLPAASSWRQRSRIRRADVVVAGYIISTNNSHVSFEWLFWRADKS